MRRFMLYLLCSMLVIYAVVSAMDATTSGAQARVSRAAQFAVGSDFACALSEAGTVKCWGMNNYGQLGNESTTYLGVPGESDGAALPFVDLGSHTARSLTVGDYHACVILDTSAVACWGLNEHGQLGIGTTLNRGDEAGEMGTDLVTVDLGAHTAKHISAGYDHTCAILENNALVCWGANFRGALGVGTKHTVGNEPNEMGSFLQPVDLGTGLHAVDVVAGFWRTCAILQTGALKCWGYNGSGALGLGDTDHRGDASGEMGNALPVVNVGSDRTVTAVATGHDSTCAVLDNGSLKCWGSNGDGQLGYDDTTTRGTTSASMGDNLAAINLGGVDAASVTVGTKHFGRFTCAVLTNGKPKCWGDNFYGVLGTGDTVTRGDSAGEMATLGTIDIGTGKTAQALDASEEFVCALRNSADIVCWGDNKLKFSVGGTTVGDTPGEMGDNLLSQNIGYTVAASTATPTASMTPTTIRTAQFAVGYDFACALSEAGTVKCWGMNEYGQLGNESTTYLGVPGESDGAALPFVDLGSHTARSLTVGDYHACVILDTSAVACWGLNEHGQLGIGTTLNRGDEAGEMGTDLVTVDLGAHTAKHISAGYDHTCAILENNALVCWGANFRGALGVGTKHTVGNEPNEMGSFLQPVDLGTGLHAVDVVAGFWRTCAILQTGALKCWGYNGSGALGLGDTDHRGDASGEMGNALPVVNVGSDRTVTAVATGHDSTCAVLDNGSLKCWGSNGDGQLGYDDTTTRGTTSASMGDNLAAINLGGVDAASVTVGTKHFGRFTCAVLTNGKPKCWGDNFYGVLGTGDTVTRGDSAGEMATLGTIDIGTGKTAQALDASKEFVCALRNSADIVCWGENSLKFSVGGTIVGDAPGEMGDNLLSQNISFTAAASTATPTASNTATRTPTPSNTATPTPTASNTATRTRTATKTLTRSKTPTKSKTRTKTKTLTRSKTPTRSKTLTRSKTKTPTKTLTRSRTATKTKTPSRTATVVATPTIP